MQIIFVSCGKTLAINQDFQRIFEKTYTLFQKNNALQFSDSSGADSLPKKRLVLISDTELLVLKNASNQPLIIKEDSLGTIESYESCIDFFVRVTQKSENPVHFISAFVAFITHKISTIAALQSLFDSVKTPWPAEFFYILSCCDFNENTSDTDCRILLDWLCQTYLFMDVFTHHLDSIERHNPTLMRRCLTKPDFLIRLVSNPNYSFVATKVDQYCAKIFSEITKQFLLVESEILAKADETPYRVYESQAAAALEPVASYSSKGVRKDKEYLDVASLLQQDVLYQQSLTAASIDELARRFQENLHLGIKKLINAGPHFLDILFKIYSDDDSLFRRWAMALTGRDIINALFADHEFLEKAVHHHQFFVALTAIYEDQSGFTSALYGLSCEPTLSGLGRIISVFQKDGSFTLDSSYWSSFINATFVDRSGATPEEGDDRQYQQLDSVLVHFADKRGNKTMMDIIKWFFNLFLIGIVFPQEWEADEAEELLPLEFLDFLTIESAQQLSLAPVVLSESLPKKKNTVSMLSLLISDNLMHKSRTDGLCKELVNLFESEDGALFDELIKQAHFVEVFLRTETICKREGVSRSESVLYLWLKWDRMRPKIDRIVAEKRLMQAISGDSSLIEALFCISPDEATPMQLIFQKDYVALFNGVKDSINHYILQDPLRFLFMIFKRLIGKQAVGESCLLMDVMGFERRTNKQVISHWFTASNQKLFLKELRARNFSLSPELFGVLSQLQASYPQNKFFSELFKQTCQENLKALRDSRDAFKTKENRYAWAILFESPSFNAVWQEVCLEADLDHILAYCQSIFCMLESKKEIYLPNMLEHLLMHPAVQEKLKEKKSKYAKLSQWLQARTVKNELTTPVALPETAILQSKSSEVEVAKIPDEPVSKPTPSEAGSVNLDKLAVVSVAQAVTKDCLPLVAAAVEADPKKSSSLGKKKKKNPSDTPFEQRIAPALPLVPPRVLLVWNVLTQLETNIKTQQLTDIPVAVISDVGDFLTSPENIVLLSNHIESHCMEYPSIKAGEKEQFLSQTRALHLIYWLKVQGKPENLSALLNSFCKSVSSESWLMHTLIHTLVAYSKTSLLENSVAKKLLKQWISRSQDSAFFKAFIRDFQCKQGAEISDSLMMAIRKELDGEHSSLDNLKFLYLSLQFSLSRDLLVASRLLPLIAFFNATVTDKSVIKPHRLIEIIQKELTTISTPQFKLFMDEVFMTRKIVEICQAHEKDRDELLRAQLKFIGLEQSCIDDKFEVLERARQKPLQKAQVTFLATPDVGDEPLSNYMQLPDSKESKSVSTTKVYDINYRRFFAGKEDIAELIHAMLVKKKNYYCGIVGSRAQQAALGGLFMDMPHADLDFDVLSCKRSLAELEQLETLEAEARHWLDSLALKHPLTNIGSYRKHYDQHKGLSWCSFKARVGDVSVDFRFLYTTADVQMTKKASIKARCLTVKSYFWDLHEGSVNAPKPQDVFDFTISLHDLTINNICYALSTLAVQAKQGQLMKMPWTFCQAMVMILSEYEKQRLDRRTLVPLLTSVVFFKEAAVETRNLFVALNQCLQRHFRKKMANNGFDSPEQMIDKVKDVLAPAVFMPVVTVSSYGSPFFVKDSTSPDSLPDSVVSAPSLRTASTDSAI